MKWLILLFLILALNGCNKEDVIATTAKEFNVELVSTNVGALNPTSHPDFIMPEGTLIDDVYSASEAGYTREALFDCIHTSYNNGIIFPKGTIESHDYPRLKSFLSGDMYAGAGKYLPGGIVVTGVETGKAETTAVYGILHLYYETSEPAYPNIETVTEDGSSGWAKFWITGGATVHIEHTSPVAIAEVTYTLAEFGDKFRNMFLHDNSTIATAYATTSEGDTITGVDAWRYAFNEFYASEFEVHGLFSIKRPINPYLPFDSMNTSVATRDTSIEYTVKALNEFNAFTLAGVTATQLSYTVKDSLGVTVKTDTIAIDCTLDDDGLLPDGEVTLLISMGEMVEADGTIEIELINMGEVKLGSFTSNIAIDEGMTELVIKAGLRDYNDYTADEWGNIEEGVKAVTKKFDITVLVPYADFDKSYRRHKSCAGQFITLDGTDATLVANDLTIYSLVARGIILSVGSETLVKDKNMEEHYRYSMSFLEVV